MYPYEHYIPEHTTAPLADKTTIQMLLAIKAAYGLIVEHFYIKSAYVHEDCKYGKKVYVRQHRRYDGT